MFYYTIHCSKQSGTLFYYTGHRPEHARERVPEELELGHLHLHQIAFSRTLICAGAHWNPAACGANPERGSPLLDQNSGVRGVVYREPEKPQLAPRACSNRLCQLP